MKGIFKKIFPRKKTNKGIVQDNVKSSESPTNQGTQSPPLELLVQKTENYDDDLSTLADPVPQMGTMTTEEALKAYGDRSMTSIDRDYTRALYRPGDYSGTSIKSVSSAGLTLGDNTYGTYSYKSHNGESKSSLFQDSLSDYNSINQYSLNSKQYHEEIIYINAPPGKLGMSIDTPDDGVVIVHAIKSISPIKDQLRIGDRLLALDDEDIRFFTALKISKMISRKSSQTRKFTVARSITLENSDVST